MIKKALSFALSLVLLTLIVSSAPAAVSVVEIVPPKYDFMADFSEGMAYVELNGKAGYIDIAGKEVVAPTFDKCADSYYFRSGLAYVMAGGKDAIIDKTGAFVVSPGKYEAIWPFDGSGYAMIRQNGGSGLIDTTGKELFPPKYDNVTHLFDDLFAVSQNGTLSVADITGKELASLKYNAISYAGDGLSTVMVGDQETALWGLVDRSFTEVMTPKYAAVAPFSGGFARVKFNGGAQEKWGFIDSTGKEIVPPKYDGAADFSDGLARVTLNEKWGFVDTAGKEVVPVTYDWAEDFTNGLALVVRDNMAGYIDKTGQIVLPLVYAGASSFGGGLAAARPDDKWGFIDRTGKEIVPFTYDYDWVYPTSAGVSMVVRDGKYGVLSVADIVDAPNLGTAAAWAQPGIRSAVDKGFVPTDLQDNYTSVITRQEFCRMAVMYVEYKTGKTIDAVLTEQGKTLNPNAFSDTSDPDILAAYALGITNGTKAPAGTNPGTFTPNGAFSREQAAAMIMNTCKVVGMDADNPPTSDFTDLNAASAWAVDGINFVRAKGIMSGTSTDASNPTFNPKGTYTRQESLVSFDRIE